MSISPGQHNVYSQIVDARTSCPIGPRPTPLSIAQARIAQAIERAQFTAETGVPVDDCGRLALTIANAISAACYGPRGEKR